MDTKKLLEYFKELQATFKGEKISSNKLLEISKDFIIHENISFEKKQELKNTSDVKMASEKQIQYARSLGFNGEADKLTSREISEIIKTLKNKKSQSNYEEYEY